MRTSRDSLFTCGGLPLAEGGSHLSSVVRGGETVPPEIPSGGMVDTSKQGTKFIKTISIESKTFFSKFPPTNQKKITVILKQTSARP